MTTEKLKENYINKSDFCYNMEIKNLNDKLIKNNKMSGDEINKLWNYRNNIYNFLVLWVFWSNGFKYKYKWVNSEGLK